MKLESKKLDNIFSLINYFESMYEDRFIRLIYETELETIEIEIVNIENFEILKKIRYKILCQKDIEDLEDLLKMFISKGNFQNISKLYQD